MVHQIKELWREGQIVSVLFMDVKGAFPSVDLKMLYHELWMLGVQNKIIEWLQWRYANQKTRLVFDDYVSEVDSALGGEDQGNPSAGIGYILYAAGLLALFNPLEKEEAFRFMDDIAAMTWGENVEELHEKLGEMMKRSRGVLDWARKHNCSFGMDKFKLVDLTHKREVVQGQKTKTALVRGPGVKIGDFTVKSEDSTQFLGVMMDKALRWKEKHMIMVKEGKHGWYSFGG